MGGSTRRGIAFYQMKTVESKSAETFGHPHTAKCMATDGRHHDMIGIGQPTNGTLVLFSQLGVNLCPLTFDCVHQLVNELFLVLAVRSQSVTVFFIILSLEDACRDKTLQHVLFNFPVWFNLNSVLVQCSP